MEHYSHRRLTVALITSKIVGGGDGSAKLITYAALVEADIDPSPIELVEFADRSVQVVGTFNGGTITIEGSNNGTDWVPLTDPQGNNLTFTAGKIEQIQELTRYVRPRVTAGTGVSVNVFFVVRRASSLRT
jgi:hypothetical protein